MLLSCGNEGKLVHPKSRAELVNSDLKCQSPGNNVYNKQMTNVFLAKKVNSDGLIPNSDLSTGIFHAQLDWELPPGGRGKRGSKRAHGACLL